jgi:hypothetical protein
VYFCDLCTPSAAETVFVQRLGYALYNGNQLFTASDTSLCVCVPIRQQAHSKEAIIFMLLSMMLQQTASSSSVHTATAHTASVSLMTAMTMTMTIMMMSIMMTMSMMSSMMMTWQLAQQV